MIITHYHTAGRGLRRALRIAVAADLHNRADLSLAACLRRLHPDLLMLPGDFLHSRTETEAAFAFLRTCAALCPTFCSVGNHERMAALPNLEAAVRSTGAELLDDRCTFRNGLLIGGLSSGWATGEAQSNRAKTPPPNLSFLREFAERGGCRLLLCHHPEYYEPYLRKTNIPLIVSGHAHGGQWELFGRGVFAPGQGLFPRYTAGCYEGRLYVSRGLCNTHPLIPRFGNPCELMVIDLWPG